MGDSSGSVLRKKRLNMNLHYFALFLLLVLTVNGAPNPNPKADPKADPKAKAQMAIIFNNKHNGDTGMFGGGGGGNLAFGKATHPEYSYSEQPTYDYGGDVGSRMGMSWK